MAKTEIRQLKLAKKAYQYEMNLHPTPWGWPRDVYYDLVSEVFIIKDFPKEGMEFELSEEPENGFADIEVDGKSQRVRFYEV